MKCLLILAVTIAAVAGSSNLFDPSVDSHQTCLMCGDPVVRSYDGAYLMVQEDTKTLLTSYQATKKDPCKFQVRCVTQSEYCGDGDSGPAYLDWCGISVWTHSSKEKFFRNWMFGQNLDIFGERGQGNDGIISGINTILPNTHTFPRAGEQFDVVGHPDYWNPKVPRPTCNDHPYELWIDDVEEKLSFRSHSDCCGWAVDFWPRGRDTCINIYAQDGNPSVEKLKSKSTTSDGMCGNMDGNVANDWRECVTKAAVTPNDAASLATIAESCKSGKHEAQGYIGGTKLDNTANNAGIPPSCPAHTL